jgi:hypothetical protein
MLPEALVSDEVDTKMDIWSLGLVMLETFQPLPRPAGVSDDERRLFLDEIRLMVRESNRSKLIDMLSLAPSHHLSAPVSLAKHFPGQFSVEVSRRANGTSADEK